VLAILSHGDDCLTLSELSRTVASPVFENQDAADF
jgi:hypothetical protein